MQCSCVIMSSVACTDGQNFLTSHQLCDFRTSVSEHKECFLIFSINLFETFFILRRTERDIQNLCWYLFKLPVIVVGFWWKVEFSQQIFEKSSNIKLNENISSGSQVFPWGHVQTDRQTDRQTDVTKTIVAFHNFAKAPKMIEHTVDQIIL
jgi:hypothetical protein